MRRTFFTAALLLVLATSDVATAQFRGGGIRIGGGPSWGGGYGGYGGGYGGSIRVGGVSAAYGNWGYPYGGGYGYGRGWGGGYYGGSPYYYGSPRYSYAQPNYVLGPSVAGPLMASAPVMMTVILPKADAEVFVNDTTTTSRGTERLFESRPLEPGVNYTYTLKAKWKEDGKIVERTREVPVMAGHSFRIDFRDPAR